MKPLFFLLSTLLFCAIVFADDDHVIVGTEANFDDLISDNEFVLVEFYAPWCGHCKQLEPEYKKAAANLHESGSQIKLVKVDATVETGLASRYEIRGYPTLLFFRSGSHIPYEGDRTASGIVNWVLKKSGPASTLLEADGVKDFVAAGVPAVVGTFAEGSEDFDVFMSVAKAEDDFRFGNIVGESTHITLYTADEGEKVFEGELTKDKFATWLKTEGYPVLQELDQNVWQRSTAAKMSIFTAFFDVEDKEVMDVVKSVAKALKGKVTSTYMDSKTQAQLAERWGASGNVFPTAVVISYEKEEPALFTWNEDTETEFNVESLTAFVKGALEGTYSTYKKSEPIPESNDGPVTIVVGKTFDEIVRDPTKDVLIEFYAPWCGHCKKLAPIYDELGTKFASVDSVVIAKIDATANHIPEDLDVRGFPTLFFFPAGENATPIQYDGSREVDGFVKFIKEHATTDFTLSEGHEDL